jgi:hypothetical protein
LQEAINEAKLEDKVYKCFFLYSIWNIFRKIKILKLELKIICLAV